MTNNLEDYTYKKMPNYLYEQIKEKVFKVFKEYNINTLPIDCKKLAQSMGYKLVKYSDLPIDSLITQQSNEGCSSIHAIKDHVIKKFIIMILKLLVDKDIQLCMKLRMVFMSIRKKVIWLMILLIFLLDTH